MRVGWHYTSVGNWQKIKRQGLKPYKIPSSQLGGYSDKDIQAIWLWEKKLEGLEEIGSVIFQLARKNCLKVVRLRVSYCPEDEWSPPGFGNMNTRLMHWGNIEKFQYHNGKQAAKLCIKKIHPSRIWLEKIFDFNNLVK